MILDDVQDPNQDVLETRHKLSTLETIQEMDNQHPKDNSADQEEQFSKSTALKRNTKEQHMLHFPWRH